MKTIKTTTLIAVFTIIASAAFAAGNLKVNMAQSGSETAVIAATNLKAELYEIDVRDEYGEVIFSKETEATASYERKYDFSLLEDGIYYLEVKHGDEKYQKQFSLDSGEIEVINEKREVRAKFKFEKGNIKII